MTWHLEAGWPGLEAARRAGLAIGRTMGIAWQPDPGRLSVFHEGDPAVLTFRADGEFLGAWAGHWPMAHGCIATRRGGIDGLWLTNRRPGRVERWSMEGRLQEVLERPPGLAQAPPERWQPSSVADTPDGAVWVADGYGSHQLHRYGPDGAWCGTWDGTEEGGAAFRNPHAVVWDPRTGTLAVTDRGNRQIRWFDDQGHQVAVLAACHSPSDLAFSGGIVAIPELFTGIKVFDGMRPVAEVGANPEVLKSRGLPADPPQGLVLQFPHGICSDGAGGFWLTEGVDGGRILRLRL